MTTEQLDLGGVNDPAGVATIVATATSRGFMAESATRQRDPHHLGISAISGCTRFAAYAIARTPASDTPEPEEGRAANLGTWAHTGLLPRMAHQFADGTAERAVTLHAAGLDIPGHIDVDVPLMVLDLKTVGEWRLQAVRRSGAFGDHVMQVAGYGVARLQAGHPPRWLVIVYLDRASGEEETIVLPFANEHVMMVIDRVAEIRRWAEDDPDAAPRRDAGGAALSGPGFAFACDRCPWLRRCWGDDVHPGEKIAHQFDDAEIEALLLEYVEANAVEGPAKRRKDEILDLLASARYGTYGRVRYGRGQDTLVEDPYAALTAMKALGYTPPMRTRRGAVVIRLAAQESQPRKRKRKKTP